MKWLQIVLKVEQTDWRDDAGIMRILVTEQTLRFVIAVTDTEPGHDSRGSSCVGCSLGAVGLLASNCSGFSQSQSNYPQFKAAV